MLRCAMAFTTVALNAVLLSLLEPALAVSNAARLLFAFLTVVVLRSPRWLNSLLLNGRTGRV